MQLSLRSNRPIRGSNPSFLTIKYINQTWRVLAIPAIITALLIVQPAPTNGSDSYKITEYTKPVLDAGLVQVCSCESTGRANQTPTQYDSSGNVLHGKINHSDIGECQINNTYNGKQATELGWDIYTEDGNIKMANWMYEHEGYKPWSWSKGCWGSYI